MKREILRCPAVSTSLPTDDCIPNLNGWLRDVAARRSLRWLLAFADDGVIWGRVDGETMALSCDAEPNISPVLRLSTLQSARLFSSDVEVLLWKDGNGNLAARVIHDVAEGEMSDWDQAYDERYMLWGDQAWAKENCFTLLAEGAQGFMHLVPMTLDIDDAGNVTPPRLVVRHYLNKEGFARVVASRLVDLEQER